MALNTAAITAAMAAMSVTGTSTTGTNGVIAIKDINTMDLHVHNRDCPIMIPAPGEWKGGSSGSPDSETTFGAPGTRFWLVHQTFRYIFFQAEAGAGRDANDHYLAASQNADLLWTAITVLNISNTDVQAVNIGHIGTIQDPMGGKLIGCFFEITFRERINP